MAHRIVRYVPRITVCQGNKIGLSCASTVNDHFVVNYRSKDISLCRGCVTGIPSLVIRSNMILNRITRSYNIKGIYIKHMKYQHSRFNHYKLKSNDELLKTLKMLKKQGYRIPLFAKTQIAISQESKCEYEVGVNFDMNVKLHYWEDMRKVKHGFSVVLT